MLRVSGAMAVHVYTGFASAPPQDSMNWFCENCRQHCTTSETAAQDKKLSLTIIIFLLQSHKSAYRRSLAVSSTIISYICLCDHLEVVSEIQTSLILMFQIYKKVIKNHEELTSCSSLMHSYLFPLLDVLYRQVGNLSFWTVRCTKFRYDGQ